MTAKDLEHPSGVDPDSLIGPGAGARDLELDLGYQRLASVVRDLVAEQSLDNLLPQIAAILRDLVHCEEVVIWEADGDDRLIAKFVSGDDPDEMESMQIKLGEGITGKAALSRTPMIANDAHLDPRAGIVPGTTRDPEAIACMPLVARATLLGALSLYRRSEPRAFEEQEIELAQSFADVAALVLDNVRTRTELRELATTDDLTGLANRRRFQAELERQVASVQRSRLPLALLLLDVNDFKQVNDSHGHQAGDQLLQLIASTIQRQIRSADLAARIGGDEFAVLLPLTSRNEAEVLAFRIENAIADATRPLFTTVSIGVATLEDGANNDLIGEADHLLYDAKRQWKRATRQPTRSRRALVAAPRSAAQDARSRFLPLPPDGNPQSSHTPVKGVRASRQAL